MELKSYLSEYARLWKYLQKHSDHEKSVDDVISLRGYKYVEGMPKVLDREGIIFLDSNTLDIELLKKLNPSLGLFSKKGYFLLSDRYVLPIKDIQGNIIALVGWYPDDRKYITTSSEYFSKATLFYGLENLSKPNNVVMVEGIFDRLAVESTGYKGIATMGITAGGLKKPLYNLTRRILAVPDMDEEGSKIYKDDLWAINKKGRYLKWNPELPFKDESGEVPYIKDIDDLVKIAPVEGIAEDFEKGFTSSASRSHKIIW